MVYYRINNRILSTIMNRIKLLKRLGQAGTRVSILNPGYARLQLQSVLDGLNRESENRPKVLGNSRWEWQQVDVKERQMELRRLVTRWERADRNLEKLFKQSPGLKRTCMSGTMMLIPSRDGAAQLAWSPDLRGWQSTTQKTEARKLFIGLLVNPLCLSLGGPCARCNKFFEKSNPRHKTYCGRKCGSGMTAVGSTQARRAKEKNTMLEAAKRASIEWSGNRNRMAWEEFVLKKVNECLRNECPRDPVTVKWVTRAVNNGELIRPSNA
jgi:hypothetical protein